MTVIDQASRRAPPIRLQFDRTTVVLGSEAEAGPDEVVIPERDVFLVSQEGDELRERFGVESLFRHGPFALVAARDLPPGGELRQGGFSARRVEASGTIVDAVAPAPKEPRTAIQDLLAADHWARYCDAVGEISAYSRYSFLQGFRDAAEVVRLRVEGLGYTVRTEPFNVPGKGSTLNLVASATGTSTGYYLVCAHLDALGDARAEAWGADDNASGCAGLLTIAEAFAGGGLRHGLRLIWFGSEEHDLEGSTEFVKEHLQELTDCLAVVNLDTIGRTYKGGLRVLLTSRNKKAPLVDDMAQAAATYVPGLAVRRTDAKLPSDHEPFLDEGLSALMASEYDVGNSDRDGDNRVDIHTGADVVQYLDCDQGVAITRMVAAYLAEKVL